MPACPRCARPAATASPRCLYCGAELPAAPAPPASTTSGPEPPARTLVVVDLQEAPPEALVRSLGQSPYEAARRAERGGFHLHRIAAPDDAVRVAEALAAEGLRAWLVPEAEVRDTARPRPVRGGRRQEGALFLQAGDDRVRLAPADVLLVVRGEIVREYQSQPRGRKVQVATLEGGHRFHLHPVAGGPPFELDPGDFEFTEGEGVIAPTLRVLSFWVESLGPQAALDDNFRRLAPALGPEEASGGALSAVEALRPARRGGAALVLDNLAQFRFYSAWRAIVERLRRAAPPR